TAVFNCAHAVCIAARRRRDAIHAVVHNLHAVPQEDCVGVAHDRGAPGVEDLVVADRGVGGGGDVHAESRIAINSIVFDQVAATAGAAKTDAADEAAETAVADRGVEPG